MNKFNIKFALWHMVLITLMLGLYPGEGFADWQSDLEQTFDIVETFDQLQDWHGEVSRYSDVTDPGSMPKKLDGSPSIWKRWTADPSNGEDWIKNHGVGYVWKGTKSLCINYTDLSSDAPSNQVVGYGPSRMTTFFGDGVTGKSGYKKIHVFYMIKVRNGFFARTSDNDGWVYPQGYIKTLEICSGFISVGVWGTDADRLSACDNPQVRKEYGTNASVFNFTGGGSSFKDVLCYKDTTLTANKLSFDCFHYDQVATIYTKTDFSSEYSNDKWFGVEIIEDIGTLNNADGSLKINIYNDIGSLISSESKTNLSHLVQFDHYYNKVTIGGNMKLFGDASTVENRIYYDDFIIDDQEIAPMYFKLLSGECVPGKKLNPVQPIITNN